jgi:hypothetical protein
VAALVAVLEVLEEALEAVLAAVVLVVASAAAALVVAALLVVGNNLKIIELITLLGSIESN